VMGPLVRVAAWLACGSGSVFGLYWLFLTTPESNTLTLAASAATVAGAMVLTAGCVSGAVLLSTGAPFSRVIGRAFSGIHWFVLAALPVLLTWWAVALADSWVGQHAGEINAWFIAAWGWADVSWVMGAHLWVSRWIRWVLMPLAALSLLAALLQNGAAGARDRGWIRRAWHWRTLVLATVVFGLLLALPWQLAEWRPNLPPTWVQPAVALVRLGTVVVLWSVGAALLIRLAATAHWESRA
jgi:hypothetical protein